MTRIDVLVAAQTGVSREVAKELIVTGKVSTNGAVCTKAGAKFADDSVILVDDSGERFVSRGGQKLAKAIAVFGIEVEGRMCLDIGASTGGFTDCLLRNGAKQVIAAENGAGQMDERIRADERVISMENTDIRTVKLDIKFDFITCDVSFISSTKIIPSIVGFMAENGSAVILVKPQFEVGPKVVSKRGVVKSEKAHISAVYGVLDCVSANGLTVRGLDYSPITGGSGNIEYLLHVSKNTDKATVIDVKSVVKSAFEGLL